MSQKIKEALEKQFIKHDVIFWYDEENEFFENYKNLSFSTINTIHVQGNEFEVKHIVTTKGKEDKFLLYFNHPKPLDQDNWLLDLEIAYHLFHTNQEALILQEIGLDYQFKDLITEHLQFFKSKERVDSFKEIIGKNDSHKDLRYKMLAVTFNTDHISLNSFILAQTSAFTRKSDKIERDLERFNLSNYYWKLIEEQFKYTTESPKIYDFLIEAFSLSSAMIKENPKVSREAKFLLSIWKDSISYRNDFDKVSELIANDLQIEQHLNNINLEDIQDEDLFKLTNNKIIHELISRLLLEEISNEKIQSVIKNRENKFWYSEFEAFYQSIAYASHLITSIRNAVYKFTSLEQGLNIYTEKHYEIDLLYRKFILWCRKTNHNAILSELEKRIEKIYVNSWLLPYNNEWQKIIDNRKEWPIHKPYSQRQFFDKHIKPIIDKNQRVFVIISDALRFECGKELNDLLVKEKRYDSSIEGALSSLPSYTQLGMASLLPHKKLEFDKNTDKIRVDGMSSIGEDARSRILQNNAGERATAIMADKFMQLNAKTKGREFVKKYDVIYIYHNKIDNDGDDTTTENTLVEAVETEILYLKELLKKIANMNGNNMIITSDHGFLYQYKSIDESDFMKLDIKGEVHKTNRRFILGKNLEEHNSLKSFTYNELGIDGIGEARIAKSLNRIRVKASGSKFVHGGASLQEITIPVLKVTKKRQDTTEQVSIDILKSKDIITTNLLSVSFIQSEAVSNALVARKIRAVIKTEDGTEISDVFKYVFNSAEDNQRQREVKHRFQLTALASGKYKNQRVKLVLEEPMVRSNKWKVYKEFYYTLNISFTNDFDGF
jgi:uncharacterized protein (TIGR02687 family)